MYAIMLEGAAVAAVLGLFFYYVHNYMYKVKKEEKDEEQAKRKAYQEELKGPHEVLEERTIRAGGYIWPLTKKRNLATGKETYWSILNSPVTGLPIFRESERDIKRSYQQAAKQKMFMPQIRQHLHHDTIKKERLK